MCHPVPLFFLSSVWQTFSLQRQQDAPTKVAHCRGDFSRFPRWRGTDQSSSFLRVSDNRRSMIIYTTNLFINIFIYDSISFHIHIYVMHLHFVQSFQSSFRIRVHFVFLFTMTFILCNASSARLASGFPRNVWAIAKSNSIGFRQVRVLARSDLRATQSAVFRSVESYLRLWCYRLFVSLRLSWFWKGWRPQDSSTQGVILILLCDLCCG